MDIRNHQVGIRNRQMSIHQQLRLKAGSQRSAIAE